MDSGTRRQGYLFPLDLICIMSRSRREMAFQCCPYCYYRRECNEWTIYKDVGRMKGIRQGNGAAPPGSNWSAICAVKLDKTRRGSDCKNPARPITEGGGCCGLPTGNNRSHRLPPIPQRQGTVDALPLFPPALLFPAGVHSGLRSTRTEKARKLR